MAKQTFTVGQVLTAAQMTSLQETALGGGAASTKTANYILVAADAGTTVAMNAAGSTSITVNTGLFSAGDTVFIQNIGSGTCIITAGTATVSTSGSLSLAQYDGGTLYFVSASSAIFFGGASANGAVAAFTQRLAPLGSDTTFKVNAIASDGTAFVAVGEDGYLYESSDGITWTSRTSGFGANDIDYVAYGNALWVAVGQNGTISTSTDRMTWTTRTSNMSTNNINYVAYINSNWVAVGAGGGTTNTGGVTYSSNGTTWTRVNQSLTVGATYQSVIWNGTNYIVAANNSTNNYIYSATLAGTWIAASSSAVNLTSLFYDGTRTYIGSSTNLRYTTATDLSSTTIVDNFGLSKDLSHKQLYLYSGRFTYFENYIASISTTLSVAGYLSDKATAQNGPGTELSAAGGLSSDGSCIFVGAQGFIVGGKYGQIYTNF